MTHCRLPPPNLLHTVRDHHPPLPAPPPATGYLWVVWYNFLQSFLSFLLILHPFVIYFCFKELGQRVPVGQPARSVGSQASEWATLQDPRLSWAGCREAAGLQGKLDALSAWLEGSFHRSSSHHMPSSPLHTTCWESSRSKLHPGPGLALHTPYTAQILQLLRLGRWLPAPPSGFVPGRVWGRGQAQAHPGCTKLSQFRGQAAVGHIGGQSPIPGVLRRWHHLGSRDSKKGRLISFRVSGLRLIRLWLRTRPGLQGISVSSSRCEMREVGADPGKP